MCGKPGCFQCFRDCDSRIGFHQHSTVSAHLREACYYVKEKYITQTAACYRERAVIPIKCLKGLQACLPCPDTPEGVLSLEAKAAKAQDEGTRNKKSCSSHRPFWGRALNSPSPDLLATCIRTWIPIPRIRGKSDVVPDMTNPRVVMAW